MSTVEKTQQLVRLAKKLSSVGSELRLAQMGLEKMALMPETDPIELTFDSPFAFVLTGNGEDAGDQILFTGVVNHL